jgi:hypothetical protein
MGNGRLLDRIGVIRDRIQFRIHGKVNRIVNGDFATITELKMDGRPFDSITNVNY